MRQAPALQTSATMPTTRPMTTAPEFCALLAPPLASGEAEETDSGRRGESGGGGGGGESVRGGGEGDAATRAVETSRVSVTVEAMGTPRKAVAAVTLERLGARALMMVAPCAAPLEAIVTVSRTLAAARWTVTAEGGTAALLATAAAMASRVLLS